MPERIVRFSDQFFDRLDELLPVERGADGSPSVTDFLMLELPAIRDMLASDFERYTMVTEDPDVRVYVGSGVLFNAVAVFAALDEDSVEAFWVMFDDEHAG